MVATAGAANLDVAILQTASSLERLAITVYQAALALPVVKASEALVDTFIGTTMQQHLAHIGSLQARTIALGGQMQDAADPRYASLMATLPGLTTITGVVGLLSTLETVLRDTYLSDVAMMSDPSSKLSLAGVLGVEAQHLATLRIISALLAAQDNSLVAIGAPATSLPAAIGTAGFPDGPFPEPSMPSPPSEGALP